MKRSRNTCVYVPIPKLHVRAKKTQYVESDNNTADDDVEETAGNNDIAAPETATSEYDDVEETAGNDDIEKTVDDDIENNDIAASETVASECGDVEEIVEDDDIEETD